MSARDADDTLLEVGAIGRPHGVRGDVMVRLTADRDERLAPGSTFRTGAGRTLTVRASRPHQRGYIVTFDEINSRDLAEAANGETLLAPPLDDADTLWIHELIGRRLEEVDGTPRGTVVAVQENPASDLLVTDDDALVPLTFLVERRDDVLVVDTPPGLFDEL